MAASEPFARPKPAFVYMVRCTGGTLYTGWTTDPAARLRAHQSGRGAKYTRARGAGGFAYLELCADKRAALRREYIDSVLGNLKGQLDNTYIVDEQGNKIKLQKKGEK